LNWWWPSALTRSKYSLS